MKNMAGGLAGAGLDYLACGRAPLSWSRIQARKSAKLAAVRRASAWLLGFDRIRPSLRQGQILGTTLAQLTESVLPSSGQDEPVVRRSGKTSQAARPAPKPNDFQRSQHGRPAAAKSAGFDKEAILRVRKQADRQLLIRLAGAQSLPAGKGTACRWPSSAAVGGQDAAAEEGLSDFLRRRAGRPLSLPAASSGQKPVQFLSPREGTKCHWPSSAAVGRQDAATEEGLVDFLQRRAGKMFCCGASVGLPDGWLPSLRAQWSMPLDGACAGSDLLVRLAAQKEVREAHEARQAGQAAADCGPSAVEASSSLPAQRFEMRSILSPALRSLLGPGSERTRSSEPVVSPPPALSLPDLLPPQQAGAPTLPLASAFSVQRACLEDRNQMDDLDALAERIKLILDEQARRHGIDV